MAGDFEPEQKRYLEGFVGRPADREGARGAASHGLRSRGAGDAGPNRPAPTRRTSRAQDRVVKAGGKLSDQEKFKRELHPFDGYEKLKAQAANNEPPKPDDNFRWRFFGLFYCAPTQKSYMCRLRIPNGILKHWQFAGVADLAERYAGGYSHVTTRANLQMREIEPKNAVGHGRGHPGPRPVLARLRRRQHPQRHRHADRRHRSAGTASTRGPMRASGTSTSSTTARSTAFRASSTSGSTAPASFRCSRTPTTSASRRSR